MHISIAREMLADFNKYLSQRENRLSVKPEGCRIKISASGDLSFKLAVVLNSVDGEGGPLKVDDAIDFDIVMAGMERGIVIPKAWLQADLHGDNDACALERDKFWRQFDEPLRKSAVTLKLSDERDFLNELTTNGENFGEWGLWCMNVRLDVVSHVGLSIYIGSVPCKKILPGRALDDIWNDYDS